MQKSEIKPAPLKARKHSDYDLFYMVSQKFKVDFWAINHINRHQRKAYMLNGDVYDLPEDWDLT
jgi:hypothetical protein